METLKNLRNDFHHVFIDGDAENSQMARVLVWLDIPLLFAIFVLSRLI